jgi:hypothetical protein
MGLGGRMRVWDQPGADAREALALEDIAGRHAVPVERGAGAMDRGRSLWVSGDREKRAGVH